MQNENPRTVFHALADDQRPKTWYASSFGVNDNGQTVLIGPYDEDELIQEAERRGAVRALRGVRARLVEQRTQISGEVAFSTIDDALLALRSHEYEECEEIQELPPEQEEEFPSAIYQRIVARKQGLY